MDGVLVIDKPLGLTSFDVVARVRRLLGEKRVGHAGTLDPLATGVLVVCLGEATKLVPVLMDADKDYRATARLGVTTDTDDADPQARVLSQAEPAALLALREPLLREALAAQVGWTLQRPPRFSALKSGGQRLYDLSRKAQEGRGALSEADIEAQLDEKQRRVHIAAITVEEVRLDPAAGPPEVTFTVRCGKGTYIRSIARDLGEALGVGAHLSALRRLRVGRFEVAQAVPLAELTSASPRFGLGEAVAHLPSVTADATLAKRVRDGQSGAVSEVARDLPAGAATAVVLGPEGKLLALLERSEGRFRIARGFA